MAVIDRNRFLAGAVRRLSWTVLALHDAHAILQWRSHVGQMHSRVKPGHASRFASAMPMQCNAATHTRARENGKRKDKS